MEIKSRFEGKINILTLSGSFDAYHAPTARQWLEKATASRPACIIVNLQDVTFLDSTALSTLVMGIKHARQWKGDVRLCCPQQPVRMVLELTRLDRVFEIYNTEQEAINAFEHALRYAD